MAARHRHVHIGDVRVLFIGNSYTYFNDLPGLLARLAAANGLELVTESVVEGGMTLLGHLRCGEALSRIRSGGWDAVVLQEQSTRPLDAPGLMEAAVQELAGEVDRVGARTALYLTWARHDHPDDQAALDSAYRRCAAAVGASVVPVGPCWQRALAEDPSLALYEQDGSHPAPMGTYLAACAFYAVLAGRSPVGTPVREVQAGDGETHVPMDLPGEVVAFLQQVAWETVSTSRPPGDGDLVPGEPGLDADTEGQLLRELPLLHGLRRPDADQVLSMARRVRIPAGTVIFSKGERGATAYIVLDGEVRVEMSDGYDGTYEPWRMGTAMGVESRSLLGEQYSCTLKAVTDVTTLTIDRAELDTLAVDIPASAAALRRNMGSE